MICKQNNFDFLNAVYTNGFTAIHEIRGNPSHPTMAMLCSHQWCTHRSNNVEQLCTHTIVFAGRLTEACCGCFWRRSCAMSFVTNIMHILAASHLKDLTENPDECSSQTFVSCCALLQSVCRFLGCSCLHRVLCIDVVGEYLTRSYEWRARFFVTGLS